MFGKFFASAFTGSMAGAGLNVFAVWGYVIANAVESQVEVNPRVVAPLLGTTELEVIAALDYLCRPDVDSRSKEEEGRRLVKEGAFAYRVVNHAIYRAIRDESDRRAYNRRKKAEGRAKGVNTRVKRSTHVSSVSAHTEADTETEANTTKPSRAKKPREANGTGQETWLSPICAVWEQANGQGSFRPAAPRIAKALAPLKVAGVPMETVAQHLACYLDQTELRFRKIEAFASSYAQWKPLVTVDDNGCLTPEAFERITGKPYRP